MPIKLTANNGNIDLKVPIKQLGGAVDSVNGMTGDVVLTANDVDAIDKYNGMTPVECVFPPLFDGGSENSRIFYVKQGVINPVDYKTVTDDIKTAWINLMFVTDATVGKLSSYQSNIKGIAPLIEIGVFGEDFFNTVTYNSPCVFFDDPITQRKKITIYTYNASKKSFSVIVDGPNGFYATDAYSILNDEFSGGRVYDQHLRPYSNNANDTNSKLGQLEMEATPTKDMQIATKKYVDDSVSNPLNITSATVGQIAKITAVDDSGKPTAWEPVDMSSGSGDVGVGKQRLIADITLTEPVKSILIDMDMDGNQLSLTDVDMFAYVATNAETSYDYATVVVNGFNAFSSSNFGISTTKKTVSCFFRLREDGTASAVRSQQNQWNNYNGVDVLSSLAGSADANTGKNYGDTIRSVGIKHVGGATEALLATGTRFIVWGR